MGEGAPSLPWSAAKERFTAHADGEVDLNVELRTLSPKDSDVVGFTRDGSDRVTTNVRFFDHSEVKEDPRRHAAPPVGAGAERQGLRTDALVGGAMPDLWELERAAIDLIGQAFAVGEPPPAEELCVGSESEATDLAARLEGKHWTELCADDLRGNPELYWLRPGSFRYYLPGLMRCALESQDVSGRIEFGILDPLSPPRAAVMPRAYQDLLAPFTDAQAHAVLAFLEVLAARARSCWAEQGWPEEALDAVPLDRPLERALEYWSQRATGGKRPRR